MCSFSAGCLWRAECWRIHFPVDTVMIFCFLFCFLFIYFFPPVCFTVELEMEAGTHERIAAYGSHSVRCSTDAYSRSAVTLAPPLLLLLRLSSSQIIRKQRSLQRLWSVHSSQRTGDEGAGQRVPSQGKLQFPLLGFRLATHTVSPVINSVSLPSNLVFICWCGWAAACSGAYLDKWSYTDLNSADHVVIIWLVWIKMCHVIVIVEKLCCL